MNDIRRKRRLRAFAAMAGFAGTLTVVPAIADEAKGKLVWVDEKNSALLLECSDGGCLQIPSAKTGETYTFVIPPPLQPMIRELKEGQLVTVSYEDRKQAGYVLVSVK